MKTRIAIVLLVFLCGLFPEVCSGTEVEVFGFYSYKSKDFSLEFLIGPKGVTGVRINSKEYPGTFSYDNRGVFGSSALFQIEFRESKTKVKFLDLLVLQMRGQVKHVSCFFADVEIPDPESDYFVARFMRTFEMKFIPLDNYERSLKAGSSPKI